MKCYIGKIFSVNESDNEVDVTCMEACKLTEGQYKWLKSEDKIWKPEKKHF